jgi:Ser/Thr protein kinase RdoA (MazF antagonist)
MSKNNKLLLQQAELLYNAKVINENILGNSANLIFEIEIKQVPFILRVSEYSDKRKSHIDFELNWVNYLANNLDNVVKPVKSLNNKLYEIIQVDDKRYILCLFEKAKGKIVDCNNPREFNHKLFFDLGALMGDMHRLTKEYNKNTVKQEFEWYINRDDSTFSRDKSILDEEIQPFEQKYHTEIHALPISKDTYGIIHSDIHLYNFFVDNGHIKLFDFDDCRFDWYANDIARTLFFMVQIFGCSKPEKERTEFAETYLITYLKGYNQTNIIDKYWIPKFNLFMKYSMMDGYKFVKNHWKNEPVNPYQEYLDWHKNRIINDLPYVFIDYGKIIASI